MPPRSNRCRAGTARPPAGREADAFAARLVEGQVAPVERGLLPVVLPQPAGDRRLHQLLAQVEGVRVLVDAELVEDLVDVGALDELLGVERVDPVGIAEDADVGVGDARVQIAELRLGVGTHVLVLDREQPAVDVLGRRALLLGEVHELGRQDRLAHRASRPVDDLGGQHVADAELLAEADQHGVDAGGVGLGQLGQVADPHEHLDVGVAAADLQVAPEAGGEARADRLDDRVDEERLAELPQVGDGPVQAVQVVGRVGDQHGRRAELPRHMAVVPGEAEDVVHTGRVGHEDLLGVERVDAEREAAGLEVADHLRPLLEPVAVEREPEVDDVGAGVAVVARRRDDPLAIEVRDVVDLGEHADVTRAVARARVGLAEERRQALEVGRALRGRDAELLAEHRRVALAQTRDQDLRHLGRDLEPAGDPVRGHQGGDGDLHDRDVVVERQVGPPERLAQRGRRELAGHEQESIGHRGAPAAPGPSGCPCCTRTCSGFPPAGCRRRAARAPCPRSAAPPRSPCR